MGLDTLGIRRRWFEPTAIEGQQFAFIAKLEPRTMMGEESHGMMLTNPWRNTYASHTAGEGPRWACASSRLAADRQACYEGPQAHSFALI